MIDLDAAMGRGSNDELVRMLASRAVDARGRRRAHRGARAGAGRAGRAQGDRRHRGLHRDGIDEPFLTRCGMPSAASALLIALDSKAAASWSRAGGSPPSFTAEEVLRGFEPYCSGFPCTYVDKEGMMQGTDLDWFRRLRAATSLELTAAGGITTIDEVRALPAMNVHAALGMAIYTGKLPVAILETGGDI